MIIEWSSDIQIFCNTAFTEVDEALFQNIWILNVELAYCSVRHVIRDDVGQHQMTSLCLYSVKDKPVRGETVHQGISSNEPFAFWGISSEMILELVSICSQCRYSSSLDCKNVPVVSLVLSLRTNKIVQRRHGVSSIPELELMLTSN